MKIKKKTIVRSCLAAAGVTTASLLGGCGSSDEEKWANSPGTNGHINLPAIKDAFQKNPSVEDFEKRVNEIFEGDNLIVFQSEKVTGGFKLSAEEDLDGDKKVSAGDDLLFTLEVANGGATLQGAGATSYYKQSWTYDGAGHAKDDTGKTYARDHHCSHFHHWYGYGGYGYWRGGYYTPRPRYDQMLSSRNSYRGTSAFTSQVSANAASEQKMASKYGSSFRSAAAKTSSSRKSYVSKSVSSGSYKANKSTSGWAARSKAGTKSSFSSSRSSSGSSSSKGFGGFKGSSGFGV